MSTATPVIVTAPSDTDEARQRALGTLLTAFATDPVMRWFWPDPASYLAGFGATLRAIRDVAGPVPTTVDLLPGAVAAAMWGPPGWDNELDELGPIFETSVAPSRQREVFAFFERFTSHHPSEPHWYLPLVGVDPPNQRRGHGSTVLRMGLERCDRDGTIAYLEASSPDNRRLYERHGFEAIAVVQVADSPPVWPMIRPSAVHTGGPR
jgi:ribosomal protein S18 acetylase RimI-like enzyme